MTTQVKTGCSVCNPIPTKPKPTGFCAALRMLSFKSRGMPGSDTYNNAGFMYLLGRSDSYIPIINGKIDTSGVRASNAPPQAVQISGKGHGSYPIKMIFNTTGWIIMKNKPRGWEFGEPSLSGFHSMDSHLLQIRDTAVFNHYTLLTPDTGLDVGIDTYPTAVLFNPYLAYSRGGMITESGILDFEFNSSHLFTGTTDEILIFPRVHWSSPGGGTAKLDYVDFAFETKQECLDFIGI